MRLSKRRLPFAQQKTCKQLLGRDYSQQPGVSFQFSMWLLLFKQNRINKHWTMPAKICINISYMLNSASDCLAYNLDTNFYVITKIKSFIRTKRLCFPLYTQCLRCSKEGRRMKTWKEFQSKCAPQIDFQKHNTTQRLILSSFVLRWQYLCVCCAAGSLLLKLWQFSIPTQIWLGVKVLSSLPFSGVSMNLNWLFYLTVRMVMAIPSPIPHHIHEIV